MKKLLFLALPLFIFSCKPGVETHRAAIEGLSSDWDKITNILTDFSNGLTSDINGYTESANAYMLDEAATAALKGDAATKWQDAVKLFKASTSEAYAPIQNELSEFINLWTEKSANVTALKDGLAAGKIEGDVNAQITDLTSLIGQAKEKITSWEAKKGEISVAGMSAVENLKTVYESIATKK